MKCYSSIEVKDSFLPIGCCWRHAHFTMMLGIPGRISVWGRLQCCLNVAHSIKLLRKKGLIHLLCESQQNLCCTVRVSSLLWNAVAMKTYGIRDIRKKLQIAVHRSRWSQLNIPMLRGKISARMKEGKIIQGTLWEWAPTKEVCC